MELQLRLTWRLERGASWVGAAHHTHALSTRPSGGGLWTAGNGGSRWRDSTRATPSPSWLLSNRAKSCPPARRVRRCARRV